MIFLPLSCVVFLLLPRVFREWLTLPAGRQVNLRINFYTCALCSQFQAQLQSQEEGEEKVEQDMRAARTRRARRDYCIILSFLLYALQIKLSICLWHESQRAKVEGGGGSGKLKLTSISYFIMRHVV